MGGGTGKIGDPSFKDEARKLLTGDTIAQNIASIRRVFERFLTFGDGPTDAIMVDNAEWLDKLEYIPFLRDIGQHFSVRSEEHTSELQSLMRISYAVFCLKKKKKHKKYNIQKQ